MREVYDVSKSLTVEQQQVAQFWADGAGTATPAGHWNTIALDLIKKYMVYTSEAAVILGALNTAQADAFIACWDAKYTYWHTRPVTAIRQRIDGRWSPYLQTPFFPSYVSGHATVSGAAAEVEEGYQASANGFVYAPCLLAVGVQPIEKALKRLLGELPVLQGVGHIASEVLDSGKQGWSDLRDY